jgi:hypothetical protein
MATFLYAQTPNRKGNVSKHVAKKESLSGGTSKLETSKPLPSNQGYKTPFTGK